MTDTATKTQNSALLASWMGGLGTSMQSLHDQVQEFVLDPARINKEQAWETLARELTRMAPSHAGIIYQGRHIGSLLRTAAREMRHFADLQKQAA